MGTKIIENYDLDTGNHLQWLPQKKAEHSVLMTMVRGKQNVKAKPDKKWGGGGVANISTTTQNNRMQNKLSPTTGVTNTIVNCLPRRCNV